MRRSNCVLLLSFACAISALATQAVAVPVVYTEAISGDLSGSNPLSNFLLDVGINTISGTSGSVTDIISDLDSFALTVPGGMEIFSGHLILSDNSGDIMESTWNLNAGSASLGGGALVEVMDANSPGSHLLSAVPLGANTYNLTHAFFSSNGPNPNLTNYTFEFGVRPIVPEPASLSIAILGAGCALAFRSRRRR